MIFMGNKEQTTVNLTKIAQRIKEDLAPIFGLKNILSAGLYLFNQLNAQEQKDAIKNANALDEDPSSRVHETIRQVELRAKRASKAGRGA